MDNQKRVPEIEIIIKTKNLIRQSKLKEALELLDEFLEGKENCKAEHKECISLTAINSNNERQYRIQRISPDAYNIQHGKIVDALLCLLEIIEDTLLQNHTQDIEIEVTLDRDFESFTEEEEQAFLKRLFNLFRRSTKEFIKIIKKRKGSIILGMKIDASFLTGFYSLIKMGAIKDVKNITIKNDKWAKYIEAKNEIGLSLYDVNLRRTDLKGADLKGTDLKGADLRGADLIGVNLINVDLSNATLILANLSFENLRSANLRGANLRSANLIGANLEDAYLEDAYLYNANLCNANLCNAYLRNAYLRNADLRNADLRNAKLTGVDLRTVNLEGSKFHTSQKQFLIDNGIDIEKIDFIDDDGGVSIDSVVNLV